MWYIWCYNIVVFGNNLLFDFNIDFDHLCTEN